MPQFNKDIFLNHLNESLYCVYKNRQIFLHYCIFVYDQFDHELAMVAILENIKRRKFLKTESSLRYLTVYAA